MTMPRRSARILKTATLTLCLLLLTACAAHRAVYLRGDSQAHPVRAGQASPIDGWVVSAAALADLIECCQRCTDGPGQ